jgi:hypothetical protein
MWLTCQRHYKLLKDFCIGFGPQNSAANEKLSKCVPPLLGIIKILKI